MTRSHRVAHRLLWPVLALSVGLGFMLALAWRPPAAQEAAPAAKEQRR